MAKTTGNTPFKRAFEPYKCSLEDFIDNIRHIKTRYAVGAHSWIPPRIFRTLMGLERSWPRLMQSAGVISPSEKSRIIYEEFGLAEWCLTIKILEDGQSSDWSKLLGRYTDGSYVSDNAQDGDQVVEEKNRTVIQFGKTKDETE